MLVSLTLILVFPLQCRAHQPGECAASECSLLCADFMRLGQNRFLLDAGVRLVCFALPWLSMPVWQTVLAALLQRLLRMRIMLYPCR